MEEMKCKCGKEMELVETYRRGRREHNVYKCDCGETKTERGKLVPNKPGRGW